MKTVSKTLLAEELNSLGGRVIVEGYLSPDRYREDGRLLHCICPFHNDENLGSAMVFLNKPVQDFYCFGCSRGGKLIDLAIGYAKRMHPADEGDFNKLLDHIVDDLNINRDRVVESGCGYRAKQETIKDEVYEKLFGYPYIVIEKDFEKVVIPGKKVMRVSTDVDRLWFRTLYLTDRDFHNNVVLTKARTLFRKFLNENNDIEKIEKFSQTQIDLLRLFPNLPILEEQEMRKNAIARKRALAAFKRK